MRIPLFTNEGLEKDNVITAAHVEEETVLEVPQSIIANLPPLSNEKASELIQVLQDFSDVLCGQSIGSTDVVSHRIELE